MPERSQNIGWRGLVLGSSLALLLGAGMALLRSGKPEGASARPPRAEVAGQPRRAAATFTTPAVGAPAADQVRGITPGSPGYAPFQLRGMMALADIYKQEPRDPRWAPAMESWINDHVAGDIERTIGKGAKVTTDCRTTTCKIRWEGLAGKDAQMARELVERLYYGSWTGRPGKDESVSLYHGGELFKEVVAGDPASLQRVMAEHRRIQLKSIEHDMAPRSFFTVVPKHRWPRAE